jgi:hypothetical protein
VPLLPRVVEQTTKYVNVRARIRYQCHAEIMTVECFGIVYRIEEEIRHCRAAIDFDSPARQHMSYFEVGTPVAEFSDSGHDSCRFWD